VSPARRALILVAGIGALATAAFLLPLHAVPEAVASLGPAGPVVGVAVGASLLAALVPRTPISFACGLLFGAAVGTICAVATFVVAAVVTFAGGRLLGREFFVRWSERLAGRRLGRAWQRLDGWVTREGTLAVATVRSLPVAPYGLVGYAYGTSAVRTRHYLVGTIAAGLPSAVIYAVLGAAVAGGNPTGALTAVPTLVSLALVAALLLRARIRRPR